MHDNYLAFLVFFLFSGPSPYDQLTLPSHPTSWDVRKRREHGMFALRISVIDFGVIQGSLFDPEIWKEGQLLGAMSTARTPSLKSHDFYGVLFSYHSVSRTCHLGTSNHGERIPAILSLSDQISSSAATRLITEGEAAPDFRSSVPTKATRLFAPAMMEAPCSRMCRLIEAQYYRKKCPLKSACT